MKMEGRPIVESPSVKLLGINIYNNMYWHEHVVTIAKTASQKLGILFRCRKLYTPEQLLLLYKAQIRPSLVWGRAPRHSRKLLDSIQNIAVRLIEAPNLTKHLHGPGETKKGSGPDPAVKLESVHPMRTRYLVVVSRMGTRGEESCLLGIDCNERTTVGLVLRVLANTQITLDGDGKLYTPEQLVLLYKAQIRPSLEYCSRV
nr:unnamed protein product [Callosobruchus analis]